MKPGFITSRSNSRSRTKDNIVRWISFLALAALLAIATLPGTPHDRDVAAANSTHWSDAWHG